MGGQLNEPSLVTINGKPAIVDAANQFTGVASVTAGSNTFTVSATDGNGNTRTQGYSVALSGTNRSFVYDANGSLTSDGDRSFEWDARNQLVAINEGTHRTEFTYDGQYRRVRIVEKENGVVVGDERYIWDRQSVVERRDSATLTVTARLYRHAVQENGVARYLTHDHLLSIREVTDASAGVLSRNDYDPYGDLVKVTGSTPDILGFTGVLSHAPSDLFLMTRRAYDTKLGRWLSEDPFGTHDGPNLYAYVANNPMRWVDPQGTFAQKPKRRPGEDTNGNVNSGFSPQDNICSAPMTLLGWNSDPCALKCCQAHDRCYERARCNWSSWLTIAASSPCTTCNRTAVACTVNNPVRPQGQGQGCRSCEGSEGR